MKTGCFWSKRLYNHFTRKLGLEVQFESSDDESDTEDDRTINTNIKEGGNGGNGKVAKPDVKTVDLTGGVVPQGFASESDKEDVPPELFDMSALPEGASIYYISPEATKLFHLKEGQNVVSTINSRMIFFRCSKQCSSY